MLDKEPNRSDFYIVTKAINYQVPNRSKFDSRKCLTVSVILAKIVRLLEFRHELSGQVLV